MLISLHCPPRLQDPSWIYSVCFVPGCTYLISAVKLSNLASHTSIVGPGEFHYFLFILCPSIIFEGVKYEKLCHFL